MQVVGGSADGAGGDGALLILHLLLHHPHPLPSLPLLVAHRCPLPPHPTASPRRLRAARQQRLVRHFSSHLSMSHASRLVRRVVPALWRPSTCRTLRSVSSLPSSAIVSSSSSSSSFLLRSASTSSAPSVRRSSPPTSVVTNTKATTGIRGVPVVPNAREVLLSLYEETIKKARSYGVSCSARLAIPPLQPCVPSADSSSPPVSLSAAAGQRLQQRRHPAVPVPP